MEYLEDSEVDQVSELLEEEFGRGEGIDWNEDFFPEYPLEDSNSEAYYIESD